MLLTLAACDHSLYPVQVPAICTHKTSMAMGREGFVTMYNITWQTPDGIINNTTDAHTYSHTMIGGQYIITVWKTKAKIRKR